jgi:nicotinamidase-related amidase
MKTALLLVDIQNDYFPGGAMELEGTEAAGRQAQRLLAHFRQAQRPVIHVQHISTRPGATFFLPDSAGVQPHPLVRPLPDEPVFEKHYPNALRSTALLPALQAGAVQRLVVAGMMTHMCVDATVRAATDAGFECLIAQDACATRALTHQGETVPAAQVHRAFLAALNGVYGKVLSAEALLAQLAAEPVE